MKNYSRPPWTEQLFEDLKRHEGLILKPYKDTVGVWTIGYGHTQGVTSLTKPITKEEAERLLLKDIGIAVSDVVRVFPSFHSLDYVRKIVLANMSFNLGVAKLAEFKATLECIRTGRFQEAAIHMLNSRWAKQVKGRATELADRMSQGKIKPEHDLANKKNEKQGYTEKGESQGSRDNVKRDGPPTYGDALREIAASISRGIRKYFGSSGSDGQ